MGKTITIVGGSLMLNGKVIGTVVEVRIDWAAALRRRRLMMELRRRMLDARSGLN